MRSSLPKITNACSTQHREFYEERERADINDKDFAYILRKALVMKGIEQL